MKKIKRRKIFRWIKFLSIIYVFILLVFIFIKFQGKNTITFLNYLLSGQNETKNLIVKPNIDYNSKEEFEKKITDANLLIESINTASFSSDFTVKLKEGPFVIFSTDKDLGWQISSLQSIISRLTIDSKKPVKVDFRFEKPIVTY